MAVMKASETIKRMETTLALLSIRESPYGFEPEATKGYDSAEIAGYLALDAAQLLAHYREAKS